MDKRSHLLVVLIAAIALSGAAGLRDSQTGGEGMHGSGAPAGEKALVSIVPAFQATDSGGTFSVRIMASGIKNAAGFQMDVQYDSEVLEFVSAEEGNFFSGQGFQTYWVAPRISGGVAGNMASVILDKEGSGTGSGDLAVLTFSARGLGTSAISLKNLKIIDRDMNSLDVSVYDGSVEVA